MTGTQYKEYKETFSFNPTYGKSVDLVDGDGFDFTRIELDEQGVDHQYSSSADIVKKFGNLMVVWNGCHYFPDEFFHDQDFEVIHASITHNIYEN